MPYRIIESDAEIDALINEFKPDIWVNDCLDTDEKYMRHLKSMIPRVISIEDLGSGIKEADAVINALYDDVQQTNVYSGWEYVCLRDEFQIESPNIFNQEVRKVLIMFGGTDPANLNKTLYEIILKIIDKYKNIKFEFITGLGYKNKENGVVTREEKNIFVYPDVPRVTKYMRKADLALTFVLVGSFMLAGCSKDEILNHYNNIVQSAGSIELTEKSIVSTSKYLFKRSRTTTFPAI